MVSERVGKQAVLRIERDDPLVVSCAVCGGVTQVCGDEDLLPWKVLEHWLRVHWDRTGLDEQADGA